jgi:Leucine-rich repeat (LRR) protein
LAPGLENADSGMGKAFAEVHPPTRANGSAAGELTLLDALKLFPLFLRQTDLAPGGGAVVMPDEIAGDSRRRMMFRLGQQAARELGVKLSGSGPDDLMALAQQIVIDHALSGNPYGLFVSLARLEGKLDEAAWAAADKEKIVDVVAAFLQSTFKPESDMYGALAELAAAPPLPGRSELARETLRQHGIDPDALLEGSDAKYAYQGVAMFTPALVLNSKAGEHYFNRDKLTAEDIRKMKLLGGGTPSEAQIAGMLARLPDSLDGEFTRRFDAHKLATSAPLARWLAARLSLYARDAGIDLADATVTISRARMRFQKHRQGGYGSMVARYRVLHSEIPAQGFVVSIRCGETERRCFVSNHTGAVQTLSTDVDIAEALKRERDMVFEDAATRARLRADGEAWLSHVVLETMGTGTYGSSQEWLSAAFQAEIERGREAARGQTPREGVIDILLNLIPFRMMIVSLQRGDVGTAILAGSLDVLSLLPLIGAGFRLSTAAVRAGAPWVAMGGRLGGIMARQGVQGLRHVPGRMPALRDSIKASLTGVTARAWGRARPLDIQRVAAALRSTSPKLADLLDGIVATAREAAIPDGVWRVSGAGAAASGTNENISALARVTARNLAGGELTLLPYGNRTGVFTRVDTASGQRLGAVLVADSEGWLYPSIPMASLERLRVDSPDIVRTLGGRRAGPDGTIVLDTVHYVRIAGDYIQVTPDRAVSTAGRPLWRVAAPEGTLPDLIPQRLYHDSEKGVWRQAEAPALGGQSRFSLLGRTKAAPAGAIDARVVPSAAQQTRFQDMLVTSMRNATSDQVEVLRALLDRLASHRRGNAILRAMAAHYELRGQLPQIVLPDGTNGAQARPSLDRPVRSTIWNLDLETLRFGTTEAAVGELAAVYNNMTGLLENRDPFHSVLARGEPALDAALEQAWAAWLSQDPEAEPRVETQSRGYMSPVTPRELAVDHLRTQLREMRCYGGLDKLTFKTLLWNGSGRVHRRVNLSHRALDSVPPLPRDITSLILSHNPIRDWSNLPAGLTTLHVDDVGMMSLPPNLPNGLVELNASNNVLGDTPLVLPPGLKRLNIGRNGLTALPVLPDGLESLLAYRNHLQQLPDGLPAGLLDLDVSSNDLTVLPLHLPSGLKSLRARHNRLSRLPDTLPGGVRDLDVSMNQLTSLPTLPPTLRDLEVGANALEELPSGLPRGLEVLGAQRNRLHSLPDDLPSRLAILDLQRNEIAALPANITALRSCVIHLHGNPIPAHAVPHIALDAIGPRIYMSVPDNEPGRPFDGLAQAARYWLAGASEAASARWDAIEQTVGSAANAAALTRFLDRLRHTLSYRDPALRTEVKDWLVEVSKPERKALLEDSLAICQGAEETCEDRVISSWNDLRTLQRNDDIRQGLYDDRVDEVIDVARQMFRINVLSEIARRKERTLIEPDEVEVYLAYVVRLRSELGLSTVAPAMRFYDLSGVTPDDVVQAREAVRARERVEFDKFLVLDYEPWQTLLKRRDAKAYAAAQDKMHRVLETDFEQLLQAGLSKLNLDPADTVALADARKDLGPEILRQIRYSVLAPLTRALREQIASSRLPA